MENGLTLSEKYPILHFSIIHAFNKRYNLGLLLAMFIPVLLFSLLLFFTDSDYSGGYFHLWYYRIYFRVILFFLVSLAALLVGTGMFRDLLNDETIVYLFTKPISRYRIYGEVLTAYAVISIAVVTPGLIVYHITGDILARIYDTQFTLSISDSIYNLLLEVLGAYIILLGLGAIFVMTGLGLKRPLLINLLIAFGIIIEAFLLDLISNNFEPVYIASNIVAKGLVGFSGLPEIDAGIYRFSLGIGYEPLDTFFNFLAIFALTILLGLRVTKRKQIV
ncbi:MAG: hypothetical protein ACXAE3_16015 [Candidatus Kariarchaeaceae archaeon]|jgi:hypothetical protein